MCCDSPITLPCITKCDSLVIPMAITDQHTIKTSFNGAMFNIAFLLNASDYAVCNMENMNEDYTYIIGVYDSTGSTVGCYKIEIKPNALCC
jgi:hypothetical protein